MALGRWLNTRHMDPLRIALLTYRGNPLSGGQGVYVRYLSRALCELGHDVEVFSGQPLPEVDAPVRLTPVPSLDLYRQPDPFRVPRKSEFRDWVDVLEFANMCLAGFPEPLTFSLRMARILRSRAGDFDVVHDNQCLGYGLLDVARRLPMVTTIHHPVTIDARLERAAARGTRRISLARWYAFTRMQRRVARRIGTVITASASGRNDAIQEFDIPAGNVSVVPNGVDTNLFEPLPDVARRPGRIITTTSADVPIKGLIFLIEAIAKLRTEREVELVVIGKLRKKGPVQKAIDRFGIGHCVHAESDVDALRLVELYATAEVAVVPSLYEGFSLPAAEAMACEVPVVATTGGALPEVVGTDGSAGILVPPRDAGALASAIATVLDAGDRRARMGSMGRARVLERFTWKRAAELTAEQYQKAIASC